MGRADGVDVESFHQLKLFAHRVLCDVVTGDVMVVVAVDTFHVDRFAINEELAIFDDGGFEPDLLGVEVGGFGILRSDADDEGVEVRVLGRPWFDIEPVNFNRAGFSRAAC